MRDAEVGRLAQMERLRWRTPVCPWGNCFIIRCQDRGSSCDPFVRVFPCLWLQQSLCTASALGSRPPPPLEQPDQVLQDDGASQEHQVAGNWDRAKHGHLPVERSCRGGNDLKKTLHMWKRSPQAHGQSPIGQDSRQSAGSNSFPVKRICERDAKELAEGARRNDAGAAVVVDSFPEKPTVKQRQKRGCKSETKNRKHPETKPGCLFESLQKKV